MDSQSTERTAGYRLLDHVTDAFIESWGPTLEQAYAQSGRALFDTMLNIDKVQPGTTDTIRATGHDEKELLYNWLEQLLLKFEVDSMVYSKFEVSPINRGETSLSLMAKAKGELFDPRKHEPKIEVKGVTYHLMEIDVTPQEARVRFLLDL
jgi:SHS2 domain-containing protein